jgi:hypothetical protein
MFVAMVKHDNDVNLKQLIIEGMFALILLNNCTFTVAKKQHLFVTTNIEFCYILSAFPH